MNLSSVAKYRKSNSADGIIDGFVSKENVIAEGIREKFCRYWNNEAFFLNSFLWYFGNPGRMCRRLILNSVLVFLFFVVLVIITGVSRMPVRAQSSDERLKQLSEQIIQYEKELSRLKNQSATLSNQIAQYDAQITLTSLRIRETENKIEVLSNRIDQLELSLTKLFQAFSLRATEVYKMSRQNTFALFLFSSPDLKTAVSRFYYLKKIQESDRSLMGRLQSAQLTYQGEKTDQESLQEELEIQKKNLDAQKKSKANLLLLTRNNERRYQDLLSQARSEFEAIQAIIAGRGEEVSVGTVSQGSRIASLIQGPSCNSSGTHLHFIVSAGGNAHNPFSYLKSGVASENCSGSYCGSSDGDAFNPSGSWDWPISGPIKLMQGYGNTWSVKNTWVGRIYNFHNGIDIDGSSAEVRAVKAGNLFRGSYQGSGGCKLRYVRVDHGSDLSTLYLHINY